ncbi:MAG TPA: response regulator [Blastocatellia bacterium]
MRILIVEDNPSVPRMMVSFLSRLAGEIDECGDGAEALTAYSKRRSDWVLMDIKMAEVDGLTATRQIKAQFPDAKIIIVPITTMKT